MTEPEPAEEKEPTSQELEQTDAEVSRGLHLLGRILFKKYRLTRGVPEARDMRAFLLNIYTSYSMARSVERQEALTKDMHKQSTRMSWLTVAILILTAAVAGPQVWRIVCGLCNAFSEISWR